MPSLNIITGETGAGKSIIINAVKLLSGKKASEEHIRYGKEKGQVEADFVRELEKPLKIERAIFSSGKSRARISGNASNLKELCEEVSPLLSICGQREYELLWFKVNFLVSYSSLTIIFQKFNFYALFS